MSALTIEGTEIRALSPEGAAASMPLGDFIERVAGRPASTRGFILPDGIKTVATRGPIEIWVHQTPPQVHNFRWIASDSRVRFGRGTTYRHVRIALPYLITLAVYAPGERGVLTLSGNNECFFANTPLRGWDDELCYPALLNCSKFDPPEGKPLSWICTQYLDRSFDSEPDIYRRVRSAFGSLMRCLLDAGFNYSSEHHEASSWFTESATVDPRIATIEAWEAATLADRLFATEVPWIATGLSLEQIVNRIFSLQQATRPDLGDAAALVQLVFNHAHHQAPATPSPFPESPFADPLETSSDIPF